jgi:uncharacterized protein (DUF924 family)
MKQKVLQFWFDEINPSQWFSKSDEFDRIIVERFSDVHAQAVRSELYDWRGDSRGRLAEIIVLDQFSRNMFRGTPLSFAQDPLALALAQEALTAGADKELTGVERGFLYLPFMHSESIQIHEVVERLYRENGGESGLEWELKHKAIIERFGRYPHRNEVLGRKSTPEEIDFLTQAGSSF